MPFEYLDESVTSDLTFHAWGRSLEETFSQAADATTNAMVADLSSVRAVEARPVDVAAATLDLLLKRFLDEIVYRKDAERLLLRADGVRVERSGAGGRVVARLCGEPIDPARHELGCDVKGITLHGLALEPVGPEWHAQVTLDV